MSTDQSEASITCWPGAVPYRFMVLFSLSLMTMVPIVLSSSDMVRLIAVPGPGWNKFLKIYFPKTKNICKNILRQCPTCVSCMTMLPVLVPVL